MKTLTFRDQEIHKAQVRLAEVRSNLHTLAALGDPLHSDYIAASRKLDEAQLALTAAFGIVEEFDCAFCEGKWDGKGRVVISLHHAAIHSEEDGRVVEEFEYSTGNQRHLALCPDCAAPLTRMKPVTRRVMKPINKLDEASIAADELQELTSAKAEEATVAEVEEVITVRAIAQYFNRR